LWQLRGHERNPDKTGYRQTGKRRSAVRREGGGERGRLRVRLTGTRQASCGATRWRVRLRFRSTRDRHPTGGETSGILSE